MDNRVKKYFMVLAIIGGIVFLSPGLIFAEVKGTGLSDVVTAEVTTYDGMEEDTKPDDYSAQDAAWKDSSIEDMFSVSDSVENTDVIAVVGGSADFSAETIPPDASNVDDTPLPSGSPALPSLSNESGTDTVTADIRVGDDTDPASETVVGATIRRDIEDDLYLLVPKLNSSRCISVAGNSKAAGANVQLVARNCGFAQAFYVRKIPGTSRYTFVNYHTGLAVSIDDGSAVTASGSDQSIISANVIQNPLTNALNQQWVLEDMGNGYLQIRACGKAYVLDLPAAQTDPGTNVQVYKANQTDAQQWKLVKAYGKIAAEARLTDAMLTKGYYRISPSDISALSVDITSNSKSNNANVRLFTRMNTGAQIFRIVPLGDGTYTINGYNSGKYLNCANAKAGLNYSGSVVKTKLQCFLNEPINAEKIVIRRSSRSCGACG